MPADTDLPRARAADAGDELAALRAELRCVLQHPSITPARRQAAEPFICRCTRAARLWHWLALAVGECACWEDQVLAAEKAGR